MKLLDKVEIGKNELPLVEPPQKKTASRASLERLASVIKMPKDFRASTEERDGA